jgi:hypothetical protein
MPMTRKALLKYDTTSIYGKGSRNGSRGFLSAQRSYGLCLSFLVYHCRFIANPDWAMFNDV